MPTITIIKKDLETLSQSKLSLDEIEFLAHQAKGEVDDYDKQTDELKIDFGDTNLPYLWSTEGFARFIKGYKEIQKGIPKIKVSKANYTILADKSVQKVRPFVAGFAAKGKKIDDALLKQIIQLQEKLSDNYGKRRSKISIGVYAYDQIKFPITYKAVKPESVSFVPLEFDKEINLSQVLQLHPKGKEYAYVLKDADKYPILIDSNDQVLSFVPIINSNFTGRVQVGDENIFFEVTGTYEDHVNLACTIFAYALADRGFDIVAADIQYDKKKITTPLLDSKKATVKRASIANLFGIEPKDAELKKLITRALYNVSDLSKDKVVVEIPPFRDDHMHEVDIIEDIGIQVGYDNIEELPLTSFTKGSTSDFIAFTNKARELIIGQGFQEVMSNMLSNKTTLYQNMNLKDTGTVEIAEYMSERYSVIRSWILPQLLELMSQNKHQVYPQKMFEEGIVNTRKGKTIHDFHRIAAITSHEKADYTEIRQVVDYLLTSFDFDYTIEETTHDSFIQGRVGRIIVNKKKIGYLGELHPAVLANWSLEMPAAGLEINVTELFEKK